MKHIFKKVSSVCTALLCAATIIFAGAAAVWADEIDASAKATLISTSEGLTETIVGLSDEDIANYSQSADDFTVQAMTAWTSNREELGAMKENQSNAGETEVTLDDDTYTVTVPVSFEKADANFVYYFDATTGAPTSITVDIQYSMAETLKRAGMNTVMGIGIVFVMLVFLSFVIYLFKFIPNPENKKKAAPAPAPAPVPVAAPVEEAADDTELIAVIAAAIAASEGTSTDGFVVRSIRKINRKKR